MSQGCNLIFSIEDSKNFPLPDRIGPAGEFDSRQLAERWGLRGTVIEPIPIKLDGERFVVDPVIAASHGIDPVSRAQFCQRTESWSKDCRELVVSLAGARPDLQASIIRGFGNPKLYNEIAAALPKALAEFKQEFPAAKGLLEKAAKEYGPWQTTWLGDLANQGKGVANGIAYELLMANRMRAESVDGLQIFKTDLPNFGQKHQGRYGEWGNRRSVESDLLISRPVEFMGIPQGYREIYVDFKYRTGSAQVSASQLEGIAIALRSGEIHEAHFVSNKQFTSGTKTLVESINKELRAEDESVIRLHEDLSWK